MTASPFPPPGDFVPSTPNPSITAIVYSIIRSVLGIASGFGLGLGIFAHLPDAALMTIAGGIAGVIVGVWSLYDKRQAQRRTHSAAVRSAVVGRAVAPG